MRERERNERVCVIILLHDPERRIEANLEQKPSLQILGEYIVFLHVAKEEETYFDFDV